MREVVTLNLLNRGHSKNPDETVLENGSEKCSFYQFCRYFLKILQWLFLKILERRKVLRKKWQDSFFKKKMEKTTKVNLKTYLIMNIRILTATRKCKLFEETRKYIENYFNNQF